MLLVKGNLILLTVTYQHFVFMPFFLLRRTPFQVLYCGGGEFSRKICALIKSARAKAIYVVTAPHCFLSVTKANASLCTQHIYTVVHHSEHVEIFWVIRQQTLKNHLKNAGTPSGRLISNAGH